jgi:hypothetical protein
MMRFLKRWLVPILAALMIAGIVVSFVPLTRQAEARAQAELTVLMSRAFTRIEEGAYLTEPVLDGGEESLLSKATAVARFLAHDDALLASDALLALCTQLSIDRIDIADADGTLIASSDETRIGLALGAQDAFAWTMAAASDESAALTKVDETVQGELYACVGRSDIEGFVLLTRDDPYVAQALANADAETLIADLPYGKDVLFQAQSGGEDGFFNESDNYYLRKTENGVTLIAARPTSEVFAVRNAAILSFGVSLVCILICGIAAYLLRLDSVITLEEEPPELDAAEDAENFLPEEAAAPEPEPETEPEPPAPRRRGRKQKQPEPEAEPEQSEVEVQHEQAVENAPRQAGRTAGRKSRAVLDEQALQDAEDAFEKIVE